MWPEAFLARAATSSITSLLSDACTVGKPTSTVLSAALGRRDSGTIGMLLVLSLCSRLLKQPA